jgi:hypothetical protein
VSRFFACITVGGRGEGEGGSGTNQEEEKYIDIVIFTQKKMRSSSSSHGVLCCARELQRDGLRSLGSLGSFVLGPACGRSRRLGGRGSCAGLASGSVFPVGFVFFDLAVASAALGDDLKEEGDM